MLSTVVYYWLARAVNIERQSFLKERLLRGALFPSLLSMFYYYFLVTIGWLKIFYEMCSIVLHDNATDLFLSFSLVHH